MIKAQVNRKIHNHLKPKEREREKERKERRNVHNHLKPNDLKQKDRKIGKKERRDRQTEPVVTWTSSFLARTDVSTSSTLFSCRPM